MRIVVIGATGNIATSLLPMLSADPSVDSIVGVARRPPDDLTPAKLSWHAADIVHDDLDPVLAGADACVHLAWEVQPSHDEFALARTNVHGTARLLEAVNRANVPAFVYASSIGTYARGPKDRAVDESWPATGIRTPPMPGRRPRSRRCSTSWRAHGRTSASSGCGRR